MRASVSTGLASGIITATSTVRRAMSSIVAHNGRVRPPAGADTDKLAFAYCLISNTKIAIMFVFHGAPGNAEGRRPRPNEVER